MDASFLGDKFTFTINGLFIIALPQATGFDVYFNHMLIGENRQDPTQLFVLLFTFLVYRNG
jgi:hypothetical protein